MTEYKNWITDEIKKYIKLLLNLKGEISYEGLFKGTCRSSTTMVGFK